MGLRQRQRQKYIKQYVTNRDGLVCCYCGKHLTQETVTMEHIIPDSLDGPFNATNLTVACAKCNNKRGSKPFFEFCQEYNFSPEKIEKYKTLYSINLKIKILNIAKEEILNENQAVPIILIYQASQFLKIDDLDISIYETYSEIKLFEMYESKIIKFNFEKLIKILDTLKL
jgi:hypothetical protein